MRRRTRITECPDGSPRRLATFGEAGIRSLPITRDVDVLFLFPVLLAYGKGYVWRDFIEITMFIGILSLVIVYAWCRGVFTWKRRPENL